MHWNETFLLDKNRLVVTSTCLFNKTFDLMLELLLILNEPFIFLEIFIFIFRLLFILTLANLCNLCLLEESLMNYNLKKVGISYDTCEILTLKETLLP